MASIAVTFLAYASLVEVVGCLMTLGRLCCQSASRSAKVGYQTSRNAYRWRCFPREGQDHKRSDKKDQEGDKSKGWFQDPQKGQRPETAMKIDGNKCGSTPRKTHPGDKEFNKKTQSQQKKETDDAKPSPGTGLIQHRANGRGVPTACTRPSLHRLCIVALLLLCSPAAANPLDLDNTPGPTRAPGNAGRAPHNLLEWRKARETES